MASILRSIIIFPLTAGHSRSRNLLQDDMDAKISSAVLMASFVSIALTSILIFGALFYSQAPEPSYFLWGFYTIKDLLGFVCVVILCVVLHSKRNTLLQPTVDYARGRKTVFLWVFGLGYLLKESMNITINADCAALSGQEMFDGDIILSIFSHLISISFTVSILGFISYFARYKINSTKLTNYGMYFILASNLTEWFKSVMREIYAANNVTLYFNSTALYFNSCYAKSPIKRFASKYLHPVVQPAQTEYSLLATLVLLGMMSTNRMQEANEINEYRRDDNLHSVTGYDDDAEPSNTTSGETEDNDFYVRESDRLVNSINSSSRTRETRKPLSFYTAIGTGIFLSMPFLVVTLIVSQSIVKGIATDTYRTVEFLFNVSTLLVVLCGFHSLRIQCRECTSRSISPTEWLLIFSNLGVGMDRSFAIAAFMLRVQEHSSFEIIVFFRHIIVFVYSFYQTILIIQAHRYRKLPRRNVSPWIKVEHCFMILHIMNFMLWVISVFSIKHMALKAKNEVIVFGEGIWKRIVFILWPINIFYCFQSTMELYGLYRKFDTSAE